MPDGDAAPSRFGGGTSLRESSLAWNVSGAAAFEGSGCDEDPVAHAAIANPTTTGKVRLILVPPCVLQIPQARISELESNRKRWYELPHAWPLRSPRWRSSLLAACACDAASSWQRG